MKFALGQINPTLGDIVGNTEKICNFVQQGTANGADIIVFPELSITGYPPQDLLDSASLIEKNISAVQKIAQLTSKAAVVVGFIDNNPNPHGKRFFNAAALLRNGRWEATYHKALLPSYDVFDDERFFEPGSKPLIFSHKGERCAVTICEDFWPDEFLPRAYTANPLSWVQSENCDWLINLSASPFHEGKPAIREQVFKKVMQLTGASIVFCNQVGANDDLIFDGRSAVVEKKPFAISYAKSFAEDLFIFDSNEKNPRHPSSGANKSDLLSALELGVRDYVQKTHGSGVCLGLSGGIDSCVVAAIAVNALGASKVKGLLLPSRFTSSASNEDALSLAKNLNIQTLTLPIDGLCEAASTVLISGLGKKLSSLTLENIQPRLRMSLLMAVANEENLLLLNTSNKSELATGYSTLYGDSAGALGVLGDVTKDQVYALARELNSLGSGIAKRAIDRPPSAELREDQTDQDSLPPYSHLDPMVRAVVEKNAALSDLLEQGFTQTEASQFLKLYRQSEYKRRQFPPILRVSARAFGRGRKIPVASVKPW